MIPTTTFHGWIKQIPSDGLTPDGMKFLERHFPGFFEEDSMMNSLRSNGIKRVMWSTGGRMTSTGRFRRYSGGKSLSRNRYFSLCSNEDGNDRGTLVNELMAYSGQVADIRMFIIDSTIHGKEAQFIINSNDNARPYPHFLALLLFPLGPDGRPVKGADVVTFKLNIFRVEIENVLDLRMRHVQDWFCETFVKLENEAGLRGIDGLLTVKRHPNNFRELLPTLLDPERGGHNFHDSVGGWLRAKGINALIFPSARMNVSVRCSSQDITAFEGWSLVIYAGDKKPKEQDEMTGFGQSGGWASDEHAGIRAVRWEDDGINRFWSVEKCS